MSDEFLNSAEELRNVAQAINSLRSELKTALLLLNQIERRIKVNFADYPSPHKKPKKLSVGNEQSSKMQPEELNKLFQELVISTHLNGEDGYNENFDRLQTEVCRAIAKEVGITVSANTSDNKIKNEIRKRVQQSISIQYRE